MKRRGRKGNEKQWKDFSWRKELFFGKRGFFVEFLLFWCSGPLFFVRLIGSMNDETRGKKKCTQKVKNRISPFRPHLRGPAKKIRKQKKPLLKRLWKVGIAR